MSTVAPFGRPVAVAGPPGPKAPPSGEWWVLGGVAAELAGRLGVPVGFSRGLLLLGSFVQPDVVYAYLLAALVLPHAGRRWPDWSNVIALWRAAVALGLLWSLTAGNVLQLDGGIFDAGPEVWIVYGGVFLAGFAALLATGVPSAARDRTRDRLVVLAAAPLIAAVVAVAAGVVLVPDVRWERVLAVVAIAAGLAAVLGGGRVWAVGVVVPAGAVAVAALLLATAGVRLDGGTGARRVVPLDAGSIPPSYRRAAGDLAIDLAALGATPGVVSVRASVGIGTLTVTVPADAEVTAVERVGRGTLEHRGPQGPGFDERLTVRVAAEDPHTGRASSRPRLRLRIVVDVGIGHLAIRRVGPFEDGPL